MYLPGDRADWVACRAPGEGQAPGALKGGVPEVIQAPGTFGAWEPVDWIPCGLIVSKFNIHAKSFAKTKFFNLLIMIVLLWYPPDLGFEAGLMAVSKIWPKRCNSPRLSQVRCSLTLIPFSDINIIIAQVLTDTRIGKNQWFLSQITGKNLASGHQLSPHFYRWPSALHYFMSFFWS